MELFEFLFGFMACLFVIFMIYIIYTLIESQKENAVSEASRGKHTTTHTHYVYGWNLYP